ncbi:MAG: DUF4292 domain-containing protein [Candidatus Kapabacteria bacterium]|nr:DUF4292 domain-containing protein [Candidatus Kapabacteria bacterium]
MSLKTKYFKPIQSALIIQRACTVAFSQVSQSSGILNLRHLFNIFSTIFILFFILSCSTSKQISRNANIDENLGPVQLKWHNDMEYLELNCNFNIKAGDNDASASGKFILCRRDSLSLSISGPFGISIGKLFSRKDYFLFYNTYQNEIYEGTPTVENLSHAVRIPLSYSDLVALIRAETPESALIFKESARDKDLGTIDFKAKNASNEDVFVKLNNKNSSILEYSRRNSEGELIHVTYTTYFKISGFYRPKKINIRFPQSEVEIEIIENETKINKKPEKPLSFNKPDDVPVKRLE